MLKILSNYCFLMKYNVLEEYDPCPNNYIMYTKPFSDIIRNSEVLYSDGLHFYYAARSDLT